MLSRKYTKGNAIPGVPVNALIFCKEYLALVVISSALSVVCSQKCSFRGENARVQVQKLAHGFDWSPPLNDVLMVRCTRTAIANVETLQFRVRGTG